MRKKFIVILLILIIIYFLINLIVNKIFLPRYITIIENKLSERTNTEVTIKNSKLGLGRLSIKEIEFLPQAGNAFYLKNTKVRFSLLGLLKKKYKIKLNTNLSQEPYSLQPLTCNLFYNKNKDILNITVYSKELNLPVLFNIIENINKIKFLKEIKIEKGITNLNMKFEKVGVNFSLEIDSQIRNLISNIKKYSIGLNNLNLKGEIGNFNSNLKGNFSNFILKDKLGNSIIKKGTSDFKVNLPQEIKFSNTKFNIKNTEYKAEITIENPLRNPQLLITTDTGLYHLELSVERNFANNFDINKFLIQTENSQITGSGSIENELINLNGKGRLLLADTTLFTQNEILKNLSGLLNIDSFNLVYPIETKNYKLDLITAVNNLAFKNNIVSEKGELNLNINKNYININDISLRDKEGIAKIIGKISLKNNSSFLKINIKEYPVENIAYFFNKKRNQKGKLNAEIDFNGNLKNKKSYRAQGYWILKDAEIANINLLGPIADLIGLPEFKEIKFNSGKGELKIVDENFYLTNTQLTSENLEVYLEGKIGFDKKLNIVTTTKFGKIQKKENQTIFSQVSKYLWQMAGEFFYKIKITGTLDNPKYQVIPSPIEQILNKIPLGNLR
jgi:autotransporter translocation and assembly factor TamB